MNRRHLMISVGACPWMARAAPGAAGPAVRLPHDFGAHPQDRIEWWYATGSLAAGDRTWGFQVTFFRTRTPVADDHPSRFAARELVFAHAALTDLAAGRQLHDQRMARSGFGVAGAASGRTAVTLRDWGLARAHDGVYRTRVASPLAGFAFDLQLRPTQPPLLQGRDGWSRKGPSHASHYYSEPQLAVTGALTRHGATTPVTGRAWLDHEWSPALLAADTVGWDWLGMNLDDGGALTVFQLRRADGSTAWAGGSHRPPGGAVRDFEPHEVRFTAGRTWRSPASQARYPVAWTVETPVGRFEVAARMDAQELDSRSSTGLLYWEGLSELRRDGVRVGQGYLEMTGYASRLVL